MTPAWGVDGARLLERLASLAAVGADRRGGLTRTAFGPAFVEARTLVAAWCRQAGLEVGVDPVGNLVARYGPPAPARVVVVGSHLDTVERAGPLDGAYGVLAGLAALEALAGAQATPPCGVVLAGFVNEEGAGGTTAMTGSRALAGRLDPAALDERDGEGACLRDLLGRIGGDPDRVAAAALPAGSIAAYLECHVEQGPVLEARGDRIGVVSAISGRALLDAELVGSGGHAGTTPMGTRHDALVAAARLVLAVEDVAGPRGARVATSGAVSVEPGTRNQIPERARLLVELRDDDTRAMARAIETLRRAGRQIAEATGVCVRLSLVDLVEPSPTDSALRADIARAATRLGLAHSALPSGAGHDAQSFAGIAPIGMVFVPSVGGRSHVPDEATAPEDLVAGAEVLAETLQAVLGRSPGAFEPGGAGR